MPTDDDDADHDRIDSTTTLLATPTPVDPGPSPTAIPGNPIDHPERPVNSKPSGTTGEIEDEIVKPTDTSSATPTPSATANSSWLPSFFPTFGVSSKTQYWIYGSLALILIFCSGLGVYFYLARRKRARNARDNYEFELLNDEEGRGLTRGSGVGPNTATGGRKGRRRAGELYDAFAAGSEDESDLDDEDGREYRDTRGAHVVGEDEDEDEEINEKTETSQVYKA